MGRPNHEPDGPGKTEAAPAVRDDADAGSGAAWTDGTRTMEACRGQTARAAPDARRSDPTTATGVSRRPRCGPGRVGTGPDRPGADGDRRPRPPPNRLDQRHQPDGDPR